MRNFNLIWLFIFANAIVLNTGACDNSAKKQEPLLPELTFEIKDSLLGPEINIDGTYLKIRPPIGFKPVGHDIIESLQLRLKEKLGDSSGFQIRYFFIDSASSAGMSIATINSSSFVPDTAAFLERYSKAMDQEYGNAKIIVGDFEHNNLFFRNYVITDSLSSKIQLLCLPKQGYAIEVQYFSPKGVYPFLVKAIESSIGSIRN